jgi:hypothetical protein
MLLIEAYEMLLLMQILAVRIGVGNWLIIPADHNLYSSEIICPVRERLMRTVSDRANGYGMGTTPLVLAIEEIPSMDGWP